MIKINVMHPCKCSGLSLQPVVPGRRGGEQANYTCSGSVTLGWGSVWVLRAGLRETELSKMGWPREVYVQGEVVQMGARPAGILHPDFAHPFF